MPPTSSKVASATNTDITRWLCSSIAGARNAQTCQRMNGSASRKPASSEIFTEVRNGSAGLNVVGLPNPFGSGRFSQSRIRPWNEYATTKPMLSATSDTTMRARNSPRCSTRVASSPWRRRRGSRATELGRGGVVLARRCRRRRRRLRGRRQLRRRLLVLAADGVLELPHALPERAPHLREPLRAEHEQHDEKQNRELPWSDPTGHEPRIARLHRNPNGDDESVAKKRLSEQVVVVTGASSGLGRAIARGAGERGAKVVVTARNAEAVDDAVREIEAFGGEALAVPADHSVQDEVAQVVEQALDRFGRIDTYISNAIVTVMSEAEELAPDELRQVMDVNFFGMVYGF